MDDWDDGPDISIPETSTGRHGAGLKRRTRRGVKSKAHVPARNGSCELYRLSGPGRCDS